MVGQVTVVTPPEPSTTWLLSNIKNYQREVASHHGIDGSRVTFLLDTRDYDRIRRLATSRQKYLYLFIVLEQLRSLGKVKRYNYRRSYGKSASSRYIRGTRDFLDSLNPYSVDTLSSHFLKGWVDNPRHPQQIEWVTSIGESEESLMESRESGISTLNRIGSGLGTRGETVDYLEKMLKRLSAAQFVSDDLSRIGNTKVAGIATRPGGVEVLERAPRFVKTDILDEIGMFSGSYYYPRKQTWDLSTGTQKAINEIVRDLVDVGTDEPILPHLDFIKHLHPDMIENDFEPTNGTSEEEIRRQIHEEAREALEEIDDSPLSEQQLNYASMQVSEGLDGGFGFLSNAVMEAVDALSGAIPTETIRNWLSNSADSLRLSEQIGEMKSEREYGDAALLIAATTVSHPRYEYNRHGHFYRWFNTIWRLFKSPTKSDREWLNTQRNMDEDFVDTPRWYEWYGNEPKKV